MPAAVGCPRIAFPLLAKASMDEPSALAACSEVQREQALAHFCILKPFLAGPLPLSAVARAERVPVCTLQRWVTRYWQQGLKGLMCTRRTDQGKRRVAPENHYLTEGLDQREHLRRNLRF